MKTRIPETSKRLKTLSHDGLVLLVDPDQPAWAAVNRLGADIARLCNGRRSVRAITAAIAEKYSVPEGRVRRDIERFLEWLEKARIVNYGNASLVERKDMSDHVPPVLSVCFELTEKCNLKCAHCFENAGKPRTPDPSTRDAIDWINRFTKPEGITMNLSGGEFFTRSDWRELTRHLVSTRARGVILTNGTLMDDETAAWLSETVSGAPITIQVSLDGHDPATNDPVRGRGTFDRITHGIGLLVKHGLAPQTAISFTPNRLNIGGLEQMLELATGFGLRVFHVSILHRMGRATGVWRKLKPTTAQQLEFYDLFHRKSVELEGVLRLSGDYCSLVHDKTQKIPSPLMIGCRLGVDIKVDTLGDIYPCPPMSYDAKYRIGNIRDMTVDDIRTSPALVQLRKLFVPRIEQSPGCRSCAWKCFCAAGCMGRAEQNYGTVYHGDDLCRLSKKLYEREFFRRAEAARNANAQAAERQ